MKSDVIRMFQNLSCIYVEIEFVLYGLVLVDVAIQRVYLRRSVAAMSS